MKKNSLSILSLTIISLSFITGCSQPTINTAKVNSSASDLEKNFKVGAIIDKKSIQDYSDISNFKKGTTWSYTAKIEDNGAIKNSKNDLLKSFINSDSFKLIVSITDITDENVKIKTDLNFLGKNNSNEQTISKKDFLQVSTVDSSSSLSQTKVEKALPNYKFEGMENVTVPSGTYNAVKLSSDISTSTNKASGKAYFWLVKNIGPVKLQANLTSPLEITYAVELSEFKN